MRYPVTPVSGLGCQRARTEKDAAPTAAGRNRTPAATHTPSFLPMTADALEQESIRRRGSVQPPNLRHPLDPSAALSGRRRATLSIVRSPPVPPWSTSSVAVMAPGARGQAAPRLLRAP